MKKIFFGLSVFLSALISAQNYPDYYPTNTNNNSNTNNGYYGDEEDSTYFPDDYYYEYPADYYTNDFYQSSYNDYQRSIYEVNWNNFFARYRLSPFQIQQIMMLNDSYPSYSVWNSYYRYNPDRWYYDRFYALQNILGPRIFVVFQNNYYHGYNPVVYYQNYRRQHYVTNIYVVPRYRNININRYRIDRTQYHQINPRTQMSFQNTPRNGNGNWRNNSSNNGFKNDTNSSNVPRNNGFRNQTESSGQNGTKTNNGGFRNNSEPRTETATPKNNGGFRNNVSGTRRMAPPKKIENNSREQKNSSPGMRSSNNSGQRFTSR
jgi:hypothetical protein